MGQECEVQHEGLLIGNMLKYFAGAEIYNIQNMQ